VTSDGETAVASGGAPTASPPAGSGATIWGFLKVLGKIAVILLVLGAVLFAWVVWQLQQSYPAPKGVPAPVSWTTRDVSIVAEQPEVTGRLTLNATTIPTTGLRVGVNAGVPSLADASSAPEGTAPEPSSAPDALIRGPVVRLTATTSSVSRSCVAPCELELPADFASDSEMFHMEIVIRLELGGDLAGLNEAVRIGVAGGVTARPGGQLPTTLTVDLVLDDAPAPSAPAPSAT
jgi:hypothetical protein